MNRVALEWREVNNEWLWENNWGFLSEATFSGADIEREKWKSNQHTILPQKLIRANYALDSRIIPS